MRLWARLRRVGGYSQKLVDEPSEKSFVARVLEPLRNKLRPQRTQKVSSKPKLRPEGSTEEKKRTTALQPHRAVSVFKYRRLREGV